MGLIYFIFFFLCFWFFFNKCMVLTLILFAPVPSSSTMWVSCIFLFSFWQISIIFLVKQGFFLTVLLYLAGMENSVSQMFSKFPRGVVLWFGVCLQYIQKRIVVNSAIQLKRVMKINPVSIEIWHSLQGITPRVNCHYWSLNSSEEGTLSFNARYTQILKTTLP